MANKFLGEAGVDVLVNEIKKKSTQQSDFDVWFNQLKECATITELTPETECVAALCVLQSPSQLLMALKLWFSDCPNYGSGFDIDVINKTISMFETILADTESNYTILWGYPMKVAVKNNTLWHQLTAPYSESGTTVEEITADEVTNKFNS